MVMQEVMVAQPALQRLWVAVIISEHIAAMAELGYGVSYLTVGLAFKF